MQTSTSRLYQSFAMPWVSKTVAFHPDSVGKQLFSSHALMSCLLAHLQVRGRPAPCPVLAPSCLVPAARACQSVWAPWVSPLITLPYTASPMLLRAPLLDPSPPPSHPPPRVDSPASRLVPLLRGPLSVPLRAPQATPLRTHPSQLVGKATVLVVATALLSPATLLMSPLRPGTVAHLQSRGPHLAPTGTMPLQKQGSLTLDATGIKLLASVMHPVRPARTGPAAPTLPTLAPTACPG